MTVEALLASIGSRELTEWMVVFEPDEPKTEEPTVESSLRSIFGRPRG